VVPLSEGGVAADRQDAPREDGVVINNDLRSDLVVRKISEVNASHVVD
jgi:hypothetical protein